MAHIYKKYEFDSKEEAQALIDLLSPEEHSHTIVELGHIVKQQGEYDEEGNEIVAPIISDKYAVDVLWTEREITNILSEAIYDEEGLVSAEVSEVAFPDGWVAKEVYPTSAVHTFAGWSFSAPEVIE